MERENDESGLNDRNPSISPKKARRKIRKPKSRHSQKKTKSEFEEYPPLHYAVIQGNLEEVRRLLGRTKKKTKGKPENGQRANGFFPAEEKGKEKEKRPKEAVELPTRKKKGVRINTQDDDSAEASSVCSVTLARIEEMLRETDAIGATALHHACALPESCEVREGIVELLIDAVERVGKVEELLVIGLTKKSKRRRKRGGLGDEGETPLHTAARYGFTTALHLILELVNDGGEESGAGSGVSRRHRRGSTQSSFAQFPDLLDAYGRTPVHLGA
jgi:ankyrin repeat protein